MNSVRSKIGAAALALVLVVTAVAFHRPLVAWFTGKSPKGHEGSAVAVTSYPGPAFDAMRSAMDAYERIRAALAGDRLASVAADAQTMAEALQAVGTDRAKLAAEKARRVAEAKTLEDARNAFAIMSPDFIAVASADSRLTAGWRVFECGMFEGHPKWIQRAATPDNPFMGAKMPTCATESSWNAATPTSGEPGAIDHYTCSMHPSVKQNGPGKCPICGMDLVAVTKEQQEGGEVMIDEARRQLIGVRTGEVVIKPMRRGFRAVGHVNYDESALTDVNLKVRGWISALSVSRTGQRVGRGQTLFTLYSPELYNAQQDFLVATGGAAGGRDGGGRVEGLGRAARQRLVLLGMTDEQIDGIAKSGSPLEKVPVFSPASGFVIEKNVVEGASVDPGMRLYRIAALDKVWVEAEVYEADLANVRVGQRATVSLDYLPGHSYEAKVAYVYPYLDPKSRTGRVRIELANKELDLRPGMYASVELGADLGARIQVPSAAVVYTGPRRLVFVDLGQGRFRPQEVQVGVESDGMYEVLSGLKPGDVVATSGVFLIAAEARIGTAAKYWEKP